MSSYSAYWRKNRSRNEAGELALALRALRKVSGHLGSAAKPVYWKGMVEDGANAIILDPVEFAGKYPMPFNRFDGAVGQVVEEGLASAEWREWVLSRVREKAGSLTPEGEEYLTQVLGAAEDIYLFFLPKARAWDLYLERRLKKELSQEVRDPNLPPSPQSLAHVWKQIVILNRKSKILHFYYELPLAVLLKHVQALREIASLEGPRARREARVSLYLSIWGTLLSAISEWETFAPSDDAVGLNDPDGPLGDLPPEERQAADEDEEDNGENDQQNGLDPELAEEINHILEEGETDVTKMIAVAVEDPQAGFMNAVIRPGVAKSDVRPDPEQVRLLKRVFLEQEAMFRKLRRRRMRRGLTEGALDPRRLYRAPIDGKIFKARDNPGHDKAWRICIVADASSSMSGKGGARKPWPMAEKAFASLASAARKSSNRIDIYSYYEERNKCVLTRLNHSESIFTVLPEGRTPSGQAIAAAAMTLSGESARTMILHITDGASNCGIRLGDAISLCHSRGIEVFTIGCGCNPQTKEFLAQYFEPENLFFLNNIKHLSIGMERLLRKKLLK